MKAFPLILSIFFCNSVFANEACTLFVKEFFGKTQKSHSAQTRMQYLEGVVAKKYITKASLGANWRKFNVEQRKQFYAVYSKYIINKYFQNLNRYAISKYSVSGTEFIEKRNICNASVTVTTKVNGENKDFPLTAVISTKNNEFKIRDIIFKNISLLQTHREEITSLLERSGFDATIKTLQEAKHKE